MMKPSLKKCRIVVIRGGRSNEREISLQTGKNVEDALRSRGHDVTGMDLDEDLFRFLLEKKVDAAFIALHGKWGEDGTVQGFLEVLGLPYTGSGVLASAGAMDKIFAKRIFQSYRLSTPQWQEITLPLPADFSFGLPAVVKPVCSGSTVGASKVERLQEFPGAIQAAQREDSRVFVEKYIEGREFTIGILGKDKPFALPVVEIRLDGFFDYENKYTPGRAEHLIPAPLNPPLYQAAQDLALKAHVALGCSGYSRVDLRLDQSNTLYLLEVNTLPGLTSQSLFPEEAKAVGICFEDLVELLVEWAFHD